MDNPTCQTCELVSEIEEALPGTIDRAPLMAVCDKAAGEEADHRVVEGGQVAGLPACDPILIADHVSVDPIAAGVADVVLNSVIAGQRSSLNQTCGNQLP